MSTWKGYEVLELLPVRQGSGPESIQRGMEVLDPLTGPRYVRRTAPGPSSTRSFALPTRSRVQHLAVRSFIMARQGRSEPFWMPWYQQEIALKYAGLSGQSYLRIHPCGFRDRWLKTASQSELVLTVAGEPWVYETVQAVSDSTPGEEQVTVSPALSRPSPGWVPELTRIYLLRLVRLENDLTRFRWSARDVGEAVLEVRELPREVPA